MRKTQTKTEKWEKINAAKKHVAHPPAARRIAAAKAKLEAVRPVLASMPHPNRHFASEGKSMADWVDFVFIEGGIGAKLTAAEFIGREYVRIISNRLAKR